MARFAVVALCVTALVAGVSAGDIEKGMAMTARAYDSVCWYEALKQFPNTQTKMFNQCGTTSKQLINSVNTNDFFKKYPDRKESTFGEWFKDKAMPKLPDSYNSACGALLKDAGAAPSVDESDVMNDGGADYSYKAYAYCMMSQLRKNHGAGAIEAVKAERTHSHKDWQKAIIDRENEFRARHGVDPLAAEKALNAQAQKWADKLAAECSSYHSKNDDADRQWNGKGTGESLAAGMGDDKEIAAYTAADGWYEEIQDYPFPIGYDDSNDPGDTLFKKIGHFTQSVWKGSQKVGYGYAYNPECEKKKTFSRFVVARYWPPGNVQGTYPQNVNPPK